MPGRPKRLFSGKLPIVATSVYETPAATYTVVTFATFSEITGVTGGSSLWANVWVVPVGETLGDEHRVVPKNLIPAKKAFNGTGVAWVLEAGDKIYVQAESADIYVVRFDGIEVDI